MKKLKLISTVMIAVGFVSFFGGIVMSMKELMEFGLYIGVAGIIGYAVMFVFGSTSLIEQEQGGD